MNEISEKQLIANAENSKLGGVKTEAGKAVTKFNALKHGILSKELIISKGDGKESLIEFQQINEQFINDLQPVGIIEEVLVEKIVTTYWRMRRVIKAENGEIRKKSDVILLEARIKRNQTEFIKLWDKIDDEHLNTVLGIEAVIHQIKRSKDDVETVGYIEDATKIRLQNCYAFRHNTFGWLACTFHDKMLRLAESGQSPFSLEAAKQAYYFSADLEIKELKKRLKLVRRKEKLKQQSELLAASLPNKEAIETLGRYEATLERAFYRALNEFQRAQAIRLCIKLPTESPINIQLNQINQNN